MPGEDYTSWSPTAANNDTADTAINWREGMARAAVNDSARSLMAAHAKHRNLTNGSITTTGAANAQAFTSGVGYTAPAPTNILVTLKIGFTNTGPATLNMDGIGNVAIKNMLGADIAAKDLTAGGYGEFLYNGTNWILLFSIPAVSAQPGSTTLTTIIADGTIPIQIVTGLDASFNTYMVMMSNVVPANNATELWIQVSEDAGVTWKTTAGDYKFAYFQANELASGGHVASTSTFAIAMTTGMSNTAQPALSGILYAFQPAKAGVYKMFQFDHTYISSANLLARTIGSGVYKATTNPINGIRISPSTGLFTTGTFTIFGIRS